MATRKKYVGIITSSTSVALIVAGFIVPPTGVIDPSVFTGVGLLLAFKVVDELPEMIHKNGGATVSVGGTKIDITAVNKSKEEKEDGNGDSV